MATDQRSFTLQFLCNKEVFQKPSQLYIRRTHLLSIAMFIKIILQDYEIADRQTHTYSHTQTNCYNPPPMLWLIMDNYMNIVTFNTFFESIGLWALATRKTVANPPFANFLRTVYSNPAIVTLLPLVSRGEGEEVSYMEVFVIGMDWHMKSVVCAENALT